MSGQISASIKKDFQSSFYFSFSGYPIAYKIDNIIMHRELVFEKTILVFGKYDLVFCFSEREDEADPGYRTTVLTRTFCESIPLTGSGLPGMAPGGIIDIQTVFGQPLHVRIKVGKPLNLKLWDFLISLFTDKTWVEVLVEGQITAEITMVQSRRNAELEIVESLPKTRVGQTSNDMAMQQEKTAIDLETLADLVQKIINQREEAKPVKEGVSRLKPNKAGEENTQKQDGTPLDKEGHEILNTEKVTELVLNILRLHEDEKARQEKRRLQHPQAAERQGNFNAPRPEGARGDTLNAPVPVPMPLEQIPSRPGLEAIIQNAPPQKPSGMGG